jgi:hypothetical protein
MTGKQAKMRRTHSPKSNGLAADWPSWDDDDDDEDDDNDTGNDALFPFKRAIGLVARRRGLAAALLLVYTVPKRRTPESRRGA